MINRLQRMSLPTVPFPDHVTYDDRYEYYMVPGLSSGRTPPTARPSRPARPAHARPPTRNIDRKRDRNDKYLLGSGPVGSMDMGGMAIMGMCSLMW